MQDRINAIVAVMANLEGIRWWYGKSDSELHQFGFYRFGLEIGECDQICELHRLLYEVS